MLCRGHTRQAPPPLPFNRTINRRQLPSCLLPPPAGANYPAMETTTSGRFLHFLHVLLRLPSLYIYRFRTHFFSFVALKELYLSLSFLRSGLLPTTVDLDVATSLHLWIPAHRTLHKRPLVLLHGFGGNSKWQWQHQIGPLSRCFDLYVPDLVFFGRSRSADADRSVGFQARSVAEAMRRLGVRKYSVCGISYGGFVAYKMAAAAEEEDGIERVVVVSAGICVTEAQRREMVEREGRDVSEVLLPEKPEDLMTLMRRSMYRPPKWVPVFLLRDFIQLIYKEYRKERVELLGELLHKGVDADPLPVLTQETLIIWGDRDAIFPLPLAHQLKSHLGKKAKLEIVKDTGHACQIENFRLVNYLIQSFLLN